MHEKRLLTNPFKKFLQNILIGLFLVILTFGGVFFGGQIFNTGNKIDEDVEAGIANYTGVWITQRVHYNSSGDPVGYFKLGPNTPNVMVEKTAWYVLVGYGLDVNSDAFDQQQSSELPAHNAGTGAANWHVITRINTNYFKYLGVADIGPDNTSWRRDLFTIDSRSGGLDNKIITPSTIGGIYGNSNLEVFDAYNPTVDKITNTSDGTYVAYVTEDRDSSEYLIWKGKAEGTIWISVVEGVSSTISFNSNGGSGGTTSVAAFYNEYLPKISVPTRYGYRFTGYFSSTSGGTRYYNADGTPTGGIYYGNSSRTMYAQWERISWSISFDQNGGTGGSGTISGYYGDALPTVTIPTKTDYIFTGYYTSATGGDRLFYATGAGTISNYEYEGSRTLYAQWAKDESPILQFNMNDTETSVTNLALLNPNLDSSVATYNSNTGIYNLNGSVGPINLALSSKLDFSVGQVYTVVFDYVGGAYTKHSTTGYLSILVDTVVESGALFEGERNVMEWYNDGTNSGQCQYKVGTITISSVDSNICRWWVGLYATSNVSYSNFKFKIAVYSGDQTGSGDVLLAPTSERKTLNSAYGALPTPTREGYVFDGWWTARVGGTEITRNTTCTTQGAHTVYAHWKKVVNVVYDYNKSEPELNSMSDSYSEIEYIESTSGQYINTGYYPNDNTNFEITCYIKDSLTTGYKAIFGSQNSNSSILYRLDLHQSGSSMPDGTLFSGTNGKSNYRAGLKVNEKITAKLNGTSYSCVYSDGSSYSSTVSKTMGGYGVNPIFVFAGQDQNANADGYVAMQLYGFKIWDDTTLVRDYVPAIRNSDGTAGLYDKVGEIFYENDGFGLFLTGGNQKALETKKLPSTYTELEYIESTGTQYINTGITPTYQTDFEVSFEVRELPSNGAAIFGAVKQSVCEFQLNAWLNEGSGYCAFNASDGVSAHLTPAVKNVIKLSASKYHYGGSTPDTFSRNTTSIGYNMFVFAANRSGSAGEYSSTKLYNFKIWDIGVLVRNFIPVKRNSDNTLGLYDMVEDVFYTNSGSGSFLKGPEKKISLPSSYTRVEYIESSGTQYIDTGVSPSNTLDFEITFMSLDGPTADGHTILGAVVASSAATQFHLNTYNSDGNRSTGVLYFMGDNGAGGNVDAHITKNSKQTSKLVANTYRVGSNTETTSRSGSISYNIYVFAGNRDGTAGEFSSTRVYSFKIWKDRALVRNFIPAIRNSDGVAGLYDLVNGSFYTNRGTGTFKTGALVGNDYYTSTQYNSRESYQKVNLYDASKVGFSSLGGGYTYNSSSNYFTLSEVYGGVHDFTTFYSYPGMTGFLSNSEYTWILYVWDWDSTINGDVVINLGSQDGSSLDYIDGSCNKRVNGNGVWKVNFRTRDLSDDNITNSFRSFVSWGPWTSGNTFSFKFRIEIYLGDVDIDTTSGSFASGYERKFPTPTRENYNFLGWTTVKNDATTLIDVNSIVPDYDHTLYALWERRARNVVITFSDCPAGTVTGDSGKYFIGDTITVVAQANENFSIGNWVVSGNTHSPTISIGNWVVSGGTQRPTTSTLTYTITEDDCDSSTTLSIGHDFGYTIDLGVSTNFVGAATSGGQVKADSGSFTTSATINQYCNPGTTNVIYAKPASGYMFYGFFLRNNPTINTNLDGVCLAKAEDCTYNSSTGYAFTFDHKTVKNPYDGMYGGGTIYALFLKQMTVSYTTNNGTTLSSRTVTYGLPYGETGAPTLTRTGYDFAGWKNGTTDITATTKVTKTANHTLTANWTAHTLKVYFNANAPEYTGGAAPTLTATTQDVTYGQTYGTLPNATLDGYKFGEWYKEKSCTNQVTSSTTVATDADHTLYAKWTAKSFTLSVSAYTNGASSVVGGTAYVNSSGTSTSQSVTFGASATIRATAKTGYTFAGWYSDSELTSLVSGSATYSFKYGYAQDTTLYASFMPNKVEVKINFVNSANNSSTANGTMHVGDVVQLKATPNTNYVFDKWVVANATGNVSSSTSSSTTYTILGTDAGREITFTAVSRIKAYTVNFYIVENSTSTIYSTEKFDYGTTYTKQVPTSKGYATDGWFTDSACSTGKATTFTNLSSTDGAVVSRYAKKQIVNYTVTYDKNTTDTVSGLSSTSKSVNYGSTYGTLPTLTRTGYTFGGWFLEPECENAVTSSTVVTLAENHTIYAKWTSKTVNISFTFTNCQNASSSSSSVGYTVGEVINLRAQFSTGYHFSTWTKTNGSGTIINPTYAFASYTITAQDVNAGSTITFTATAALNTYTVEFYVVDANNVITLNSQASYNYGQTTTKALPTSTGYTFTGWYKDFSCTGTTISQINNLTTVNGGTVKLYAKKELIKYTITYNLGSTTYTEQYTYGAVKTLMTKEEISAKQGVNNNEYVFFGWFTENPTGKGDLKQLSTTSTIAANSTGNKTYYGRFFKARATNVEGYSDASITINVSLESGLKSGYGYGIILVEYFDEELGYTRNFSFMLTDMSITISGLKYADVKITVITTTKVKVDYSSVVVTTTSKSSSTVDITLSKNSNGGYTDTGSI